MIFNLHRMKNTVRKNMKNMKNKKTKKIKGGFWPFKTSVMSWFGFSQPTEPEPVPEPVPESETVPEDTLPDPNAEPVYDTETAPEGVTEPVMETGTGTTNLEPEYENKYDERRSNIGGKRGYKKGGKRSGKKGDKTKKKKRRSSKKGEGKKLK